MLLDIEYNLRNFSTVVQVTQAPGNTQPAFKTNPF